MPADPKNLDSGTLREALEDREKRGGGHSPKLDIEIPEGFGYLFALFWELRSGITEGFGGARITWVDLRAYQDLTGLSFDAFELEALMQMDAAVREEASKK
jgi:hypothetical protein